MHHNNITTGQLGVGLMGRSGGTQIKPVHMRDCFFFSLSNTLNTFGHLQNYPKQVFQSFTEKRKTNKNLFQVLDNNLTPK